MAGSGVYSFVDSNVQRGKAQLEAASRAMSRKIHEGIQQENQKGAQQLEQSSKGFAQAAYRVSIPAQKAVVDPALPDMNPFLREYIRIQHS